MNLRKKKSINKIKKKLIFLINLIPTGNELYSTNN